MFIVHVSLFTIRSSRFTISSSRFTVHDSRFTVHGSRFAVHDSQRERGEGVTVGKREREREKVTDRQAQGREGGEGELGARQI